ncbi:MAG: anaerobic glycerol-3-phosphate dehydrogenase subunit C [Bacteroidales bacterium]|nr:anaerobic glycerol-3-phosphate dehydrogenase subunit C [Bacteroidales bacterium]
MQEKNRLESCLKCNLCTLVCPMLAANPDYPGPKKAGPDGERYRLKDPAFYDYALKYCLNCKRCEVACPSDVHVGDMIQQARIQYGSQAKVKGLRGVRDWTLASTDLVGSIASPLSPIVNGALKMKGVKALMHGVIGVDKHRSFPRYCGEKFESWFRKQDQSAFDKFVTFFHGCYTNYNYPQLGKDLVKLVNAAGYGVHLLEKEKCCGVALMSNGFAAKARRQANVNLFSMRKAVEAGESVLTVSSTCTLTMRDEYPDVLGIDNADVRDSIMLASRWLYTKIVSGEVKLRFRKDFRMRVLYHIACHMQKLGWQYYSLELLKMIPGLELVALDQNCCGIAGTFGFKKENYAYSQEIGSRLFSDIREGYSEGTVVATECETCKWQIEMSTGVPVLNPVEILARALDD